MGGINWAGGEPGGDDLHPQDCDVLRMYAELQTEGEDTYEGTESISAALGLTVEQFDVTVSRLIAGGLVRGGKTFTRSYVEEVTELGLQHNRW